MVVCVSGRQVVVRFALPCNLLLCLHMCMCVCTDLKQPGWSCTAHSQCQSGVCKEVCCNAEGKGEACVECTVRWAGITGKCQTCAANFYRNSDRECVACADGEVSSEGSTSSDDCAPGIVHPCKYSVHGVISTCRYEALPVYGAHDVCVCVCACQIPDARSGVRAWLDPTSKASTTSRSLKTAATAVVVACDAPGKAAAPATSAGRANAGCGWEEPAAQQRTA